MGAFGTIKLGIKEILNAAFARSAANEGWLTFTNGNFPLDGLTPRKFTEPLLEIDEILNDIVGLDANGNPTLRVQLWGAGGTLDRAVVFRVDDNTNVTVAYKTFLGDKPPTDAIPTQVFVNGLLLQIAEYSIQNLGSVELPEYFVIYGTPPANNATISVIYSVQY